MALYSVLGVLTKLPRPWLWRKRTAAATPATTARCRQFWSSWWLHANHGMDVRSQMQADLTDKVLQVLLTGNRV